MNLDEELKFIVANEQSYIKDSIEPLITEALKELLEPLIEVLLSGNINIGYDKDRDRLYLYYITSYEYSNNKYKTTRAAVDFEDLKSVLVTNAESLYESYDEDNFILDKYINVLTDSINAIKDMIKED